MKPDGMTTTTKMVAGESSTAPKSTATSADGGADDRAATTIQAMYRGFRARKSVETAHAAAAKIQAGFRGYRVRQSLKNTAPSTATTITDDSQCWSDDDQKSVVSVAAPRSQPLKDDGRCPTAPASAAGATIGTARDDDQLQQTDDDDEVFAYDGVPIGKPTPQSPAAGVLDGDDEDDDAAALTRAAVKIQARVRGFAARKRMNDEKNGKQ